MMAFTFDHPCQQLADVWNKAMAKLGYTEYA
jgi:hypothetical protein